MIVDMMSALSDVCMHKRYSPTTTSQTRESHNAMHSSSIVQKGTTLNQIYLINV